MENRAMEREAICGLIVNYIDKQQEIAEDCRRAPRGLFYRTATAGKMMFRQEGVIPPFDRMSPASGKAPPGGKKTFNQCFLKNSP